MARDNSRHESRDRVVKREGKEGDRADDEKDWPRSMTGLHGKVQTSGEKNRPDPILVDEFEIVVMDVGSSGRVEGIRAKAEKGGVLDGIGPKLQALEGRRDAKEGENGRAD
jgi:hypothetical protein